MRYYLRPWICYFNIRETASRQEYWVFTTTNLAVSIALNFVAFFSASHPQLQALIGMIRHLASGTTLTPYALMGMGAAQAPVAGYPTLAHAASATVFILFVATLIPTFTVTVRRLHDAGHSGWWMVIQAVPLVGQVVMLLLLLQPSDPGTPYGL